MLQIDFARHRVHLLDGMREVYLSPTEFRLLDVLVRNEGFVMSIDQLLDHVWGEDAVTRENVRQYISYLRRKLHAQSTNLIETVKEFGYRYNALNR